MDQSNSYEFNGQTYRSAAELLDALSKEYRAGNEQQVLDALDTYGYDLSDLNLKGEA